MSKPGHKIWPSFKRQTSYRALIRIALFLVTFPLSYKLEATPSQEKSFHPLPPGSQEAIRVPISRQIKQYIEDSYIDPLFQIKGKQQASQSLLQLTESQEIWSFRVSFQGVPLCNSQIKAIYSYHSGNTLILGKRPRTPTDQQEAYRWPPYSKALLRISSHWLDHGKPLDQVEIISHKPCFWSSLNQLKPAWRLIVHLNNKPYEFYANSSEIFEESPLFFHNHKPVIGKIQAFEKNPQDAHLKTYEIELIGDQTLRSSFIETDTHPHHEQYPRAHSHDHEFIYDPTDFKMVEATTFVHSSLMLEYFQGLGYRWDEPKPLKIFLHQNSVGKRNNAFYQPALSSEENQAAIYLSDGDGKVLQNLGLDRDVISHELGHHIIYRTLKKTTGESLLLHEGLADYFSYSFSQDPCLGESICPDGSPVCMIENQCLRSARNQIHYDDDDFFQRGPHDKSQIISGYLWDLRDELGAHYTDQLSFHALSYLVSSSGIKDFLVSLMFADLSLSEGVHSCTLYHMALDRGFQNLLEGVDCQSPHLWERPHELEAFPALVSPGKEEIKKQPSRGGLSCATIKKPNKNRQNVGGLLMIFLIPLILPIIRKTQRIFQS